MHIAACEWMHERSKDSCETFAVYRISRFWIAFKATVAVREQELRLRYTCAEL